MHCARGEKVPGRQRMSVEALFTVLYEGKSHQVEVSYNPGKSVAGVKKLIINELKDAIAGPRELSQMEVRVEDLTLKTLDGDVIEGARMPEGDEFSAELLLSSDIEPPLKKSRHALKQIEVKPAPLGEINDSGFFVEASGLYYAGLASEEESDKRLFMREATLGLIGLLRNILDGDSRGIRVFGAPGVGKSCTVWVWACDECLSNDKKVLWVHLMANGIEKCVLMTGKKIFEIKDRDANADIKSSDADIVIVDGVTGATSHEKYSRDLIYWGEYRKHRKFVQVASMQLKINDEDEAMNKILHFEMPPWTRQEFITACRDDEFYNHVSCAFEGLRNGVASETIAALQGEDREELILEKFFYTGCSARWMFNYTAAEVKMKIAKHLRKCNSFKDLIYGGGGDASKSAVNHLWVGYPSEDGLGFSYFFVSQYVAHLALTWCGDGEMQLLYTSARRMQNPALLGWVVEMDFIQRLHDCLRAKAQASVKTLVKGKVSQRKWDVHGIVDFEMDDFEKETVEPLKESILKHFWLRPCKWNQGGYDLACLLLVDGKYVLRFVQITAALEHSLKLKFYIDLAIKIKQATRINLENIEIVMMVPDEATARLFSIPSNKVSNSDALSSWFCGDSKKRWRYGQEGKQVRVFWFECRK